MLITNLSTNLTLFGRRKLISTQVRLVSSIATNPKYNKRWQASNKIKKKKKRRKTMRIKVKAKVNNFLKQRKIKSKNRVKWMSLIRKAIKLPIQTLAKEESFFTRRGIRWSPKTLMIIYKVTKTALPII